MPPIRLVRMSRDIRQREFKIYVKTFGLVIIYAVK
nr:MAG TPA: hypothetical protein [Crassvirales sp.]